MTYGTEQSKVEFSIANPQQEKKNVRSEITAFNALPKAS